MTIRQLTAIWIADIVGYSSLAASDEDAALALVATFGQVIERIAGAHRGRVANYMGDAAIAVFDSSEQAALAALDLRQEFADTAPLRIGLHIGEVTHQASGDVLGDGVNVAARLQTAARPGEIVVSEQAWAQLRTRSHFVMYPCGTRQLKGQPGRQRLWELERLGGGRGVDAALTATPKKRVGIASGSRRLVRRFEHAIHPFPVPLTVVLVAALAIGLMGLAALGSRDGRVGALFGPSSLDTGLDPARLAVLYFDDYSPGGELDYLANGLTEGVIHDLSQIEALEVISRNGVRPYKEGTLPLDSIAARLGVGSIVEGSVSRSGDRIRATVQLIDAATGAHVFSRVVDEEMDELFALQDRIVEVVSEALRSRLGNQIRLAELRTGTRSAPAYDAVLRAKEALADYDASRVNDPDLAARMIDQADSLFRLAADRDDRWAEPLIGLANVARIRGSASLAQVDTLLLLDARDFAERAAALAPDDARARASFGVSLQILSEQRRGPSSVATRDSAERELLRAVNLEPSDATSLWMLSQSRLSNGDIEGAARFAQRAYDKDEFLSEAAGILYQIYYAEVQLGPTEAARNSCETGRRRFPTADEFVICELFLLASFPDVEPDVRQALALVDTLDRIVNPTNRNTMRAYGTMLAAEVAARAGARGDAEALIVEARGNEPPNWLAYNEAHARLLLGDPDQAIELLSQYLSVQPDTSLLARDWWFEDLWSDPRFRTMVGDNL